MKKYQKWFVFFMALIPLIVITVILSFCEIDTSLCSKTIDLKF